MNLYEAKQIVDTVKVQVYNKSNSKKIQEKLFSLDCGWYKSREKVIQHLDQPFLYISFGRIGFGTSKEVFNKSNYREISINDILDINVDENYRPFINSKECWEEMQKHQPFGWIKSNEDGHYSMATMVDDDVIRISGNNLWYFNDTMNNYTFADGIPFGVKVEE